MTPLKHAILLLVVLMLLSWAVDASAQPISTTARDVLRTPAQFGGSRVFVTGYYVGSLGESKLFANAKNATDPRRQGDYIWVDQSVWANPGEKTNDRLGLYCVLPMVFIGVSDVESLTKHYVRLIGTFRCRPANSTRVGKSPFGCAFDWTGSSPYAITNVTYFRPSG